MRKLICLIALTLMVALPAFAQDEELGPNDENDSTNTENEAGTACSSADCHLDVDDDPDSTDGNDVCTNTNNASIRFDLQDPSANPDTGTDAQSIDLVMTTTAAGSNPCPEDAGGNAPTFSLELYCNDSATGVIPFSGVTITGIDTSYGADFTFPGACNADGSDLQFHFTLGRSSGSAPDRRFAGIEAIEWDVIHATGGRTRRMF